MDILASLQEGQAIGNLKYITHTNTYTHTRVSNMNRKEVYDGFCVVPTSRAIPVSYSFLSNEG